MEIQYVYVMLFKRYWSHIQGFQNLIRRISMIPRARLFFKLFDFWDYEISQNNMFENWFGSCYWIILICWCTQNQKELLHEVFGLWHVRWSRQSENLELINFSKSENWSTREIAIKIHVRCLWLVPSLVSVKSGAPHPLDPKYNVFCILYRNPRGAREKLLKRLAWWKVKNLPNRPAALLKPSPSDPTFLWLYWLAG